MTAGLLCLGAAGAAAQSATMRVRVTVVRAEAGRDELAAARRLADSTAASRVEVGIATVRRASRPAPPTETPDRPRRVVLIQFLRN